MAREHARVKLSIWEDDDYRDLSVEAQHLYQVLMIHPQLDYCGVTDWRPGKLAGFARNWTAEDVQLAAKELSERLYIIIDEQTEEVLIRSFIRSDGLLDSPNMAVAVRKAHMAISSKTLRGVVVYELARLREDKPDLKGWDKVDELCSKGSVNPSEIPSFNPSVNPSRNPSGNPSGNPEPTPSVNPSVGISPTTAPTPAPSPATPTGTSTSSDARGARIPDNWTPDPRLVDAMRAEGIPDELARRELARFRDYWLGIPGAKGRKADWAATWRNWIRKAADEQRPTQPATGNGTAKAQGWLDIHNDPTPAHHAIEGPRR